MVQSLETSHPSQGALSASHNKTRQGVLFPGLPYGRAGDESEQTDLFRAKGKRNRLKQQGTRTAGRGGSLDLAPITGQKAEEKASSGCPDKG